MDKFSIIASISYLFVALIFSCTFYLLMHSLFRRKAKYVITDTLNLNMSYLNQTMMFGIKNFAQGFIHAYFLDNYFLQILSLFSLKLSLFIISLFFFKIYKYKIVSILNISYYFFCLSFDAILLISYLGYKD